MPESLFCLGPRSRPWESLFSALAFIFRSPPCYLFSSRRQRGGTPAPFLCAAAACAPAQTGGITAALPNQTPGAFLCDRQEHTLFYRQSGRKLPLPLFTLKGSANLNYTQTISVERLEGVCEKRTQNVQQHKNTQLK